MSNIINKLNYLKETKRLIKNKLIDLGSDITDNDKFRNYVNYLTNIYNNYPKVSTNGTNFKISNSKKGKLKIILKASELTQNGTPTPENPIEINTINGNNTINISNSDNSENQNYIINLGDLEYCKIDDYEDELFKNEINSEFYNNELIENEWYLKKKIITHIFNGSDNDSYVFNSDKNNTIAININPNKINQPAIKTTSNSKLFCNKFKYENSGNDIEHLYLTQFKEITGGYNGAIRLYINKSRLNGYSSNLTSSQKINLVKEWLSNNNIKVTYISFNETYIHISNKNYQILKNQLDYINDNAKTYNNETNFTQNNNNLPFIINTKSLMKGDE